MMAASAGRNEWSNTRWMPWLGAISGCASGSASRRTASENGPPALTDDARADASIAGRVS